MAKTPNLDTLLRRQAKALGRTIGRRETFRQEVRRLVGGRPYSEVVRRLSTPDRFRTDLSVNGAWRFSESHDGTRAWVRDRENPGPTEAMRALFAYRWSGVRLDHLRPLAELQGLGCTVEHAGRQHNVRRVVFDAVRIALGEFAETVFLDDDGRVVGHRLDLPEADEDERQIELLIEEWGSHDGLVHPVRSTALDRRTGEAFAEIVVSAARFEPYSPEVFDLRAD